MTETEKINAAIESGAAEARELVKYLYDHPETATKEQLSSAAIVDVLRRNGFEVTYPFMAKELGYDTSFCAVLAHGSGPKVAVLVEYDALPGLGHGCGHNLHGSLATLAATSLMKLRDEFHGTLMVLGAAAEEEDGAKLVMAEAGIFDDVDLAIMMHSNGGSTTPEMDTLSLRAYKVEFHGLSAHAAAGPWFGHNAFTAARKFIDLVDARRDSFRPGTIFSSVMLQGGDTPNQVPDYASLRLEVRSTSLSGLTELDRIIRNCARGASLALDCTEEFTLLAKDFYNMVRVPALEDKVTELFRARGERVDPVVPAYASSDMGNVSYQCPAIQPMLRITDEHCALHTETLREATLEPLAFEQMKKGAAVIVEMALLIFNDAEFRAQVRAEYEAALEKVNRKL